MISLSAEVSFRCNSTLFNSLTAGIEGIIAGEDYSAIPSEQAKEEGDEFDLDDLLLGYEITKMTAGKKIRQVCNSSQRSGRREIPANGGRLRDKV